MRFGAALPMVVLSIGIVTALSVGGTFVSRQFGADTRVSDRASAVESAAEAALVLAAAALDTAVLGLPVGSGVQLASSQGGATPEPVTSVTLTRLSGTIFALVSTARTAHKPFIYKRLRILLQTDTTGIAVVPNGAWSRLP